MAEKTAAVPVGICYNLWVENICRREIWLPFDPCTSMLLKRRRLAASTCFLSDKKI